MSAGRQAGRSISRALRALNAVILLEIRDCISESHEGVDGRSHESDRGAQEFEAASSETDCIRWGWRMVRYVTYTRSSAGCGFG